MTLVLFLSDGQVVSPPSIPVVIPPQPDAMPTLGGFGKELYRHLLPIVRHDVDYDWAAAKFVAAVSEPFEMVYMLARDDDLGRPGWAILMDPDRIPIQFLPWLAQMVGVRLRDGLGESQQRERVRRTDGWERGTPGAIAAAAKQYLTGNRTVLLRERANGDAYQLTVITHTSETPNAAAVLAALNEQKPAGILLTHLVYSGNDWYHVVDNYATWNAVIGAYLTWTDLTNG